MPHSLRNRLSRVVCVVSLFWGQALALPAESLGGLDVTGGALTEMPPTLPDGGNYTVSLDAKMATPAFFPRLPAPTARLYGSWGGGVWQEVARGATVAAGHGHSLALRADGAVVAWGGNSAGQTTVPAAAQADVVAVAAGLNHSLALLSSGAVVAWGLNAHGECAVPPTANANVVAIAAGGGQSLALLQNGTVVAWGENAYALPHGLTDVVAIAAGTQHALALKANGAVVQWGGGGSAMPPGESHVVAIAAQQSRSLALRQDGTVVVWGSGPSALMTVPAGAHGAVGLAASIHHNLVLRADGSVFAWGETSGVEVGALPEATKAEVVAIAAGGYHALAVKRDGSLVTWGTSNNGLDQPPFRARAGLRLPASAAMPVPYGESRFALRVAEAVAGEEITVPAASLRGRGLSTSWGNQHVLKANGTLVRWGTGPSLPVPAPSGVVAVSAGLFHSAALKADGTLQMWGGNNYGELDAPTDAVDLVAIAAGPKHTLALRRDGRVVGWGYMPLSNGHAVSIPAAAQSQVVAIAAGQIMNLALRADGSVVGFGVSSFHYAPNSPAWRVSAVSVGSQYGMGLRNNGTVVVWGDTGSPIATSIPPDATGLIAVAAGSTHALALRSDGRVVAWGTNAHGECNVPTAATDNVVAISAGANASYAVTSGGTLIAWGNVGTIPTHATEGLYTPAGESDVTITPTTVDTAVRVPIAAGSYGSVALRDDGTPVVWGGLQQPPANLGPLVAVAGADNYVLGLTAEGGVAGWGQANYGQTAIPDAAGSGVVAIAAGSQHALALKANGTVIGWGSNSSGQLNIPDLNAHAAESYGYFFKAIAVGEAMSLGLRSDGRVIAWGDSYGQFAVPADAESGVVAIAAGRRHAVALKADGSVVGWGDSYTSAADSFKLQKPVTALVAGDGYSAFLLSDGSVMVRGGLNSSLAEVPEAARTGVIALAGGREHVTALKADGTIVSWGAMTQPPPSTFTPMRPGAPGASYDVTITREYPSPALDSLGSSAGALTPVFAPGVTAYAQTVSPQTSSVALSAVPATAGATVQIRLNGAQPQTMVTGATFAVDFMSYDRPVIGVGADGRLTSSPSEYADAQHVPPTARGVLAGMAMAGDQLFALTADGALVNWTRGTVEARDMPAELSGGIAAIAAGHQVLALTREGSVLSWAPGSSSLGYVPTEAAADVTRVAANQNTFVALKNNGAVVAWGGIGAPPAEAEAGVVSIAAGNGFAFAVKADGTLVAWGGLPPELAAIPAAAQSGVVSIQTSTTHAIALKADGTVVSWGEGPGEVTTVPDEARAGVVAVAAGQDCSAVQKADGTVVVWGGAGGKRVAALRLALPGGAPLPLQFGANQIALRVTPDGRPLSSAPVASGESRHLAVSASGAVMQSPVMPYGFGPLPAEANTDVVAVYAKGYREYALKADGSLITLSGPSAPNEAQPSAPGQTPVRAPIASVAVGEQSAIVLRSDGSTYAWGGLPTTPVKAQTGVIAVAAGRNHAVALTGEGEVVAWGHSSVPGQMPASCRRGVVAIAAFNDRNLALKRDGKVIPWGHPSSGDTLPDEVQSGVVAIAMNGDNNAALKADGSVVVWGERSEQYARLEEVASGVIGIVAGERHYLAFKADGTVVTLKVAGDFVADAAFPEALVEAPVRDYHVTITRPEPAAGLAHLRSTSGVRAESFDVFATDIEYMDTAASSVALNAVPLSTHGRVDVRASSTAAFAPRVSGVSIAARGFAGAGIRADGTIGTWGGFLPAPAGDGFQSVAVGQSFLVGLRNDGAVVSEPSLAGLPTTRTVAIAAGREHVLVLTADGELASVGRFGMPPWYLAATPAEATDVVAIAASDTDNMVLRRDGRVVTWGMTEIPVPIKAQAEVVAIAAGENHFLALRADGEVVAWGANYSGQTDVPVAATYGVVAIAGGADHSLALKADGSVVTWGHDGGGLLDVPAGARSGVVAITAGEHASYAIKADGTVVAWGSIPSTTFPVVALPLSARIPLAPGDNTLEVRVTARGDSVTHTYRAHVERTPSPDLVFVAGTKVSAALRLIDGESVYDFGLQQVGDMAGARTFTLSNSGSADLVVSAIAAGSASFQVNGLVLPLTLPPGERASFQLKFMPAASGMVATTLELHTNLPHGEPFTIMLTGEGVLLSDELAAWRTAHFAGEELADDALKPTLWGNNADPDGDGFSNFTEYAVGSNPRSREGVVPVVVELGENASGAPVLELTYRRLKRAIAAGLVYRVERNDTLADDVWSTSGISETVIASDETSETVTATTPASGTARFMRLRIEQ